MCGIVGAVGKTRSIPMDRFCDMRDSMTHRGPDDAGVWQSPMGTAVLGSRRLAILDLSPAAHQPMVDETSGLVIVFNGEIYNFRELSEELSRDGCRFRSRSDTEVLLKSYEMWGTGCLDRLNGMFAFAIWDDRKQELFAARDRFGEKPFYYYQDAERGFIAFASEIKALVVSRLFPVCPNKSAIYGYLVNREIDAGQDTPYDHVSALQAAHAMRFSPDGRTLQTWRYWDLNVDNQMRLSDDREYAERFGEILSDSVQIRLRSDVRVGSSLSGGLDSSAIVGLIARSGTSGGQNSFSARFSDLRFDEGKYIEAMARWANVTSHSVYPDPTRIPGEIELLTWHQDEPFYSTSIYAQWCVMALAKECDVTVLLDGQGGDEVLAGYHAYFTAYYLGLLKQFRLPQAITSMLRYIGDNGSSLVPLLLAGFLPERLRVAAKGWFHPRAIPKEFANKWKGPPVTVKRKFRDELHQSLYATLTQSVLPQLLRYADRNSMAFSREVRLPFLDHRLVEFLFAIPSDQKLRDNTTKVVLRNTIAGVVPEEIRNRRDKLGFAPPEVSWLRGPLRSWVEDVFSSAGFRQREWTDPEIVDSIWNRFRNGDDALHTSIWRWLSLEIWARVCLTPKALTNSSMSLPAIGEKSVSAT